MAAGHLPRTGAPEVNGDGQCAQARRELGVYVLGAIEPAQRAQADRHLAACPRCRADLAELAALPALLRKVPAGEARSMLEDAGWPAARPPLGALLDRAARIGRRRRWLLISAAAVIAVMAAALVLLALHPAG
jgi:anti-sigma factor RsiW